MSSIESQKKKNKKKILSFLIFLCCNFGIMGNYAPGGCTTNCEGRLESDAMAKRVARECRNEVRISVYVKVYDPIYGKLMESIDYTFHVTLSNARFIVNNGSTKGMCMYLSKESNRR